MVEYSLTPLGETLVKPLKTLCDWASEHMDEMEKAREQQLKSKTGDTATNLIAMASIHENS